jgi:hypothetical protein
MNHAKYIGMDVHPVNDLGCRYEFRLICLKIRKPAAAIFATLIISAR